MTFPLIVLLWLAMAALGAALPVGLGAAREGRQAGWALSVDAAARGALESLSAGGWTVAAAGVPPGGVLVLSSLAPGGGIAVDRMARRIGPDLWLLVARARRSGPAGTVLAQSEQGLLARLVIVPPDTILHVRRTARSWIRRPQ